jgi:hypothetical protein
MADRAIGRRDRSRDPLPADDVSDVSDHWGRIGRGLIALPPDTDPSMHRLGCGFPAFTQHEAFEFGLETPLAAVASSAGTATG